MKSLFIAWQDNRSRRWFPIGKLSCDEHTYTFVYTEGAEVAKRESGFSPLQCFPELDRVYFSNTLFPVFANRVFPAGRPDYSDYLHWLDLTDLAIEPIELLARSGGEKATDNLQIFPFAEKTENNTFKIRFFAHGIRHVEGADERISQLKEEDILT